MSPISWIWISVWSKLKISPLSSYHKTALCIGKESWQITVLISGSGILLNICQMLLSHSSRLHLFSSLTNCRRKGGSGKGRTENTLARAYELRYVRPTLRNFLTPTLSWFYVKMLWIMEIRCYNVIFYRCQIVASKNYANTQITYLLKRKRIKLFSSISYQQSDMYFILNYLLFIKLKKLSVITFQFSINSKAFKHQNEKF